MAIARSSLVKDDLEGTMRISHRSQGFLREMWSAATTVFGAAQQVWAFSGLKKPGMGTQVRFRRANIWPV